MHISSLHPRRAALLLALMLVVLGAVPLDTTQAQNIIVTKLQSNMPSENMVSTQVCSAVTGASIFCIPSSGTVIRVNTSDHLAADISSASGFVKGGEVYAAYPGTVVYKGMAETASDNPNKVTHAIAINHGLINGKYVLSFYIHMGSKTDTLIQSDINVGTMVDRGRLLGYQGYAGLATGVHVHFAIFESTRPFLNSYTSWGISCNRSDLWYELVAGGGCGANPNRATEIDPENYVGSLPVGTRVLANCGQSLYQAAYADQSYIPTMPADMRQNVQLKLKNTGTATWDSNTHLAPTPRDAANPLYDPATWLASNRIVSAGSVTSNQVGTFNFALRAPSTPGKYRINFTLVQEGVAWFSQPGDADIWFEVTVTEAVGAGSSRQQLFVDAYNRNGGLGQLGSPLAAVSWSGPDTDIVKARIQALSSGAFILHDEQRDNPSGSVPAYVLGGPILKHFQSIDGSRSWLGAGPTSDQFTNATGQQQSNFPNGYITWNGTTAEAKPWPSAVANQWHTEYHNRTNLDAGPTWVINEDNPSHTWGDGVPGDGKWGVWSDFSLGSTARLNFEAGEYTFVGNADDTVRVWIDGEQIINTTLAEGRATRTLSAGQHDLKVEYVDAGGGAALSFWWVKNGSTLPNPTPTQPVAVPQSFNLYLPIATH